MRILQVCHKPPYPALDGGSIAMLNLARSLSRLGHEITVLTMSTPKHQLTIEDKQEFSKMMTVHSVYVNTKLRFPAMVRNLLFSREPYIAIRFISAEFENMLVELLSAETFDIVQLEGLYLTPYIPVIRKNSNALIALRAHNVEHAIWQRLAATMGNPLKKWYFGILARRIKRFESEAIDSYDVLLPITAYDLENYVKMGNTRPAYVCPAGIDIETAGTTPKKTHTMHLTLFFLGSLDWIPNREGLLWFVSEVFPELLRRNPELKLHIAGRNAPAWLKESLQQPGILFHGQIANAKEFMQAYGIMVAPCFSGSGMRVKIIEAMAIGKPVITTPIGAEGLAVKNEENIIIASQADEFIDQVERLLNHPEFYLRIGQNAQSFVLAAFNNKILAAGVAEFYKAHMR
ncbi:MAG: glycosyltransferase family 4 protein [Bacteroidales bacterium]|nr:glycosyltransferase family 4 protein [Bacteroidales bacterium]